MNRILTVTTVLLMGVGLASGQDTTGGSSKLSAQDLENLVAPVALYPDALLDQVLDASQHPTSLVKAGDFLHDNKGGKPDPNWPPSVTALLRYPSVLSSLDDDLSWTTRLGLAYQAQSKDVDAAVQVVRRKAQAAGNLTSNDQQNVTVVNNTVQIAPASQEVVYVPSYDSSQIYAPHPAAAPLMRFGAGVALGAAIANNDGYHPHYAYYQHHYYDHIAHFGRVGPYGRTTVARVGGPYRGASHVSHSGYYGHTNVTHVGGPIAGETHVSHYGPYGHSGGTFGHVGGFRGGGFHGGGFGGFHGRGFRR